MRGLWIITLLVLGFAGPVLAAVETPASGRVVSVTDGDTFTLATGQKVRLLDMNTPELAHETHPEEAYAKQAKDFLTQLVLDKEVVLEAGKRPYDVYGRLLAHVYTPVGQNPKGNWVNGLMIREGYGHVYTFEDNGLYGDALLTLEARARGSKKGIWALSRWQIRQAETCCGPEDMGKFVLVQGVVASVGYGPQGTRYLNFGDDYRMDFTVKIDGRDKRAFKEWSYTKEFAKLKGKLVLVRGKVAPINGALLRATHPLQIEVLD
jgi:endonuclease YncB( thermonuclease family)